jgi:hypothetical protein
MLGRLRMLGKYLMSNEHKITEVSVLTKSTESVNWNCSTLLTRRLNSK